MTTPPLECMWGETEFVTTPDQPHCGAPAEIRFTNKRPGVIIPTLYTCAFHMYVAVHDYPHSIPDEDTIEIVALVEDSNN